MLQPKPPQVTDVAIYFPCCDMKQGVELKDNPIQYKQELCEGRLDEVVYLQVTCSKCGKKHEVTVCTLAFIPKEILHV